MLFPFWYLYHIFWETFLLCLIGVQLWYYNNVEVAPRSLLCAGEFRACGTGKKEISGHSGSLFWWFQPFYLQFIPRKPLYACHEQVKFMQKLSLCLCMCVWHQNFPNSLNPLFNQECVLWNYCSRIKTKNCSFGIILWFRLTFTAPESEASFKKISWIE